MQCSIDTSRLGFSPRMMGMALLVVSCGVPPDSGPSGTRLIVVRGQVAGQNHQGLSVVDVLESRWNLVGREGASFEFVGRSVGRFSYAIDDLPESCPYTELGVVRYDAAGPARTLSFVFHGPDEDHGVVVYEQSDDGNYRQLARTRPGVHAYDWPAFAHDRKTLAVWGDGLDVYERVGAWFEHTSSVRDGWFKAFPVVDSRGRVAARLIRPEPYAESVVVDGAVGGEWDRVRDPVFSVDGVHVAYMARQDGEWYLVVDGRPHGPVPDLYVAQEASTCVFMLFGGSGTYETLMVMDPSLQGLSRMATVPPRTDLPQGPFIPIP